MKNDKMMKKEIVYESRRPTHNRGSISCLKLHSTRVIKGVGSFRICNFSMEKTRYSTRQSENNETFDTAQRERFNIRKRDDIFCITSRNVQNSRKKAKFLTNVKKLKKNFNILLYNHDITFKKGNIMNNFSYPIDIIDSDDMDTKIINPLNGLIVILDALKTTNLTTDQSQSVFSALSALIFNVKEEATLMSADVDGMKEMISLGGVA
jgi:hypothetical protein